MIALLSIFSLFLTGVYVLLLLFLIRGWANVKQTIPTGKTTFTTKVTILIAARNEAESIHLTIGDILAQDYPVHLREIIIVDDHSTDNTAEIISSYANQGVKLLQLNESQALNSYKKKAIARAISLSSGELMVATDADCRMGTAWLSSIVANYEIHNPVMISSPVTYFEEASLFELMQTLEFAFLIGIGGAFIGNKRASTCNGANFAYRKDVFYEVGGFTGIDDLASGDDELLLQKVAERYPGRISFLKQSEAVVYTHAKPNLKEFMQQRRRWASKSTKYKDKRVVALGLTFWMFNFMLLFNALLGFYDFYFFKLFLVQFLIKYLFEMFYGLPILKFFKRSYLINLIFIVAPLHVIYIVVIGFIGNNKKYSWKGRVVK